MAQRPLALPPSSLLLGLNLAGAQSWVRSQLQPSYSQLSFYPHAPFARDEAVLRALHHMVWPRTWMPRSLWFVW